MSSADLQTGPRRGPLRRLLEVRGVLGGHRVIAEDISLRTRDGVELAASHLPGPSAAPTTVIVAHGFAAHRRKPAYARLADGLATRHRVVSVDLRGHGASEGRSGFGGWEALDLEAAVRWARSGGGAHLVGVGVSMGGTALVHAAAAGVELDALVLISTPSRVGRTDTEPLERLDRMWRTRWKRSLFEAISGVTMATPGELSALAHPYELIDRVRQPVLIVHGDDDHFFPFSDAEELAERVAGPVAVWREPIFGHAEDGLTRTFARRLARAIGVVRRDGTFPGSHG